MTKPEISEEMNNNFSCQFYAESKIGKQCIVETDKQSRLLIKHIQAFTDFIIMNCLTQKLSE